VGSHLRAGLLSPCREEHVAAAELHAVGQRARVVALARKVLGRGGTRRGSRAVAMT